ncbi:MAG: phosphate/phosphite/phosphonate ABC transporter substrate-binding protein [Thermoanaerobaculia bacterium]
MRPFAAVLLGLLLLAASPVAAEEPLRIVFIAYQNPDQLIEDVGPVVEYLEERLGVEVEHFAATDYAGVVEALRHGTADAGFMGPLQYVMAHQQAGARAILGEVYNGSPTYVSRIFVRKDSGLKKVADLRGHSMAFVDPISSSGYMYPLDVFKDAGLISDRDDADRFFKQIYFAGGDEQALRAVLNRFVDAAGIGQYAFNLLRPEERDQVVAIGESRPIPSHCVVVRKDLDEKLANGLQQALLALNDGDHRELLQQLYNVDGYVVVDHQTYAPVEQVAREYGFLR